MTDILLNIAAIIAFFVVFTFLIRAVRKKNKEVEQRIRDMKEKEGGTEEKNKPHNAVLAHNPSADSSGYLDGILFIIVLVGTTIAGLIYGIFSLVKDESENDEGDAK